MLHDRLHGKLGRAAPTAPFLLAAAEEGLSSRVYRRGARRCPGVTVNTLQSPGGLMGPGALKEIHSLETDPVGDSSRRTSKGRR